MLWQFGNWKKLSTIWFDHVDCTKILKEFLVLKNEVKEYTGNKRTVSCIIDVITTGSGVQCQHETSCRMGLSHDGHSTFIEKSFDVSIRDVSSLEKIKMKYKIGHRAYNFLISEHNLPKHMEEKLWPKV